MATATTAGRVAKRRSVGASWYAEAFYATKLRGPLLTVERERGLLLTVAAGRADDASEGDREAAKQARDELVKSNIRYAIKSARSMACAAVSLDDLISEGVVGLFDAVDHYDVGYTVRFTTYATYWIRRNIALYMAEMGGVARLPLRVYRACKDNYADKAVVKREHVQKGLDTRAPGSLFTEDGQDRSLLGDGRQEAPALMEHEDDVRKLRWALSLLDERTRAVIARRHEIDCEGEATLKEIGSDLGLTRERVRQIRHDGIAKLRELILA